MSRIPETAAQAAAEAIDRVRRNRTQTSSELADAALTAAMPAIREAWAQEIEEAAEPYDLTTGQRRGMFTAAGIVRGGTP